MQTTHDKHIPGLLEKKAPASVIFIGEGASSAADAFRRDHADATIVLSDSAGALEALKKQDRFDLAVVVNALETIAKPLGENLLAALRDVHAKCVIVSVRLGDQWAGTASRWAELDLLGLGMKRLDVDSPDETQGLFEFNIQDYKLSPDWLNARHWAHPELWDIYRW